MKDFAKSIRTMNSNKEEIIKKKKEEGAILKVDNGQKLEFSDGTTYVKTSFSDDYREAHNYTGNKRVANAKDKNGRDLNVGDLVKVKTDDPSLSLGKVKSVSGETISVDMTGDDDIWTTPARLVEKVGNRKVGNEAIVLKDGDVWVVLYANETKSKEFDSEAEARAFAKQVGNKKVGNSVPDNLHERFGYRLAVTKDGEGKKETISELEMAISDYKSEISEKEKELSKDKQNLQKLEAVLRKYK